VNNTIRFCRMLILKIHDAEMDVTVGTTRTDEMRNQSSSGVSRSFTIGRPCRNVAVFDLALAERNRYNSDDTEVVILVVR
jgi:hypothetical protein